MRPLTAFILILYSSALHGTDHHPYSISSVHADLQDHRIVMTIRTNAEDLLYFHTIAPDSLLRISTETLVTASKAHSQVLSSGFYILDQNKMKLESSVTHTDFSSLERTGKIDVMSLLKYPLVYTLEYTLHPSVEVLEFHQELGAPGVPAVSYLSVSRNSNTLVADVELSRNKPFTMVRNAVSISSPDHEASMVSYITLSDTRVIHELTVPADILRSFVSISDADEQSGEVIRKFIAESSMVEINNVSLPPEITALVLGTKKTARGLSSGAVHIRIEYSLTALPKDVSVSWDNFNWKMRWFKSLIDAFGQHREHNFSRFQPKVDLKREIKIDQTE